MSKLRFPTYAPVTWRSAALAIPAKVLPWTKFPTPPSPTQKTISCATSNTARHSACVPEALAFSSPSGSSTSSFSTNRATRSYSLSTSTWSRGRGRKHKHESLTCRRFLLHRKEKVDHKTDIVFLLVLLAARVVLMLIVGIELHMLSYWKQAPGKLSRSAPFVVLALVVRLEGNIGD